LCIIVHPVISDENHTNLAVLNHHFKGEALGCYHKPLAPYAILNIGAEGINVTFKEVANDNREFLLAYDKLNVQSRDFILYVFYGNQHLQF
jgi:hypothetical protein